MPYLKILFTKYIVRRCFLVMSWTIEFHEDFDHEFQGLDDKVQGEILAKLIVL